MLGGIKPRSLLALLLLHANQVMSADRLIDELWGDEPPATAAKSIQVHVSKLRQLMGDGRLATRDPGYVLTSIPRNSISPASNGSWWKRAAPIPRPADKLRQALALWRGPPLADLAYEPFAQADIARLQELRLAALELRIDADLAIGRHAECTRTRGAGAEHPLRERLRCQLMLALYRSGRQADALHTDQPRRELLEEFGLEPCEDLRRLERAILDMILRSIPRRLAGCTGPPLPGRSFFICPGPWRSRRCAARGAPRGLGAPRELIIACVVAAARSTPRPRCSPTGPRICRARSRDQDRRLLVADARKRPRAACRSTGRRSAAHGRRAPFEADALAILEQVPCDVAMLDHGGRADPGWTGGGAVRRRPTRLGGA